MESRLYDDDIYAWSEQQAAVLRRLAAAPGRLPSDLDLEHVAEEIEDLGKSERHAAESAIRLMLVHLIKLASAPGAAPAQHWRGEIVTFHIDLLSRFTPAMFRAIDLDRLWRLAKRQALATSPELDEAASEFGFLRLDACPVDIAMLTMEEFAVEAALNRLRSGKEAT